MYAADAAHPNARLREKLNRIFSLRQHLVAQKGDMDLSIRPDYFTLLERLDNPHKKLPPVIHVAGTNGKGSTIAFMRAMAEAAGLRVHTYTSPHLIRINERIVLNGTPIDDGALETLLDEVLLANGDMAQTFFEITTALAFAAFARQPADLLLLETGMGGRRDSTNVVDTPIATIITTLSYDHTAWLGHDLTTIAGEKAGIIKPGAPCIVGAQIMPDAPSALSTIRATAHTQNAPTFVMGDEWDVQNITPHTWDLRMGDTIIPALPRPAMAGLHQINNAALAMAALRTQPCLNISRDAMVRGLQTAYWPGRLQKIIHPDAPPGWDIWLDGAHNDSGAMMLARHIHETTTQAHCAPHLIIGMMAHKDARSFIAPLADKAASITIIPVPGPNGEAGHAPDDLARLWVEHGARHVTCATDLNHAMATLRPNAAPTGCAIVAGSLYLVGAVLADLQEMDVKNAITAQ